MTKDLDVSRLIVEVSFRVIDLSSVDFVFMPWLAEDASNIDCVRRSEPDPSEGTETKDVARLSLTRVVGAFGFADGWTEDRRDVDDFQRGSGFDAEFFSGSVVRDISWIVLAKALTEGS